MGWDRVNELNEYKGPSLECGVSGMRKRIMIKKMEGELDKCDMARDDNFVGLKIKT